MKKILFILITASAITSAAQKPEIQKKITGFKHPESVASDGRFFYVSNLGNVLDPKAKDGDGFISRLTKFGDVDELNAFPEIKMNSPKGMTVLNEVLYVTDVDSLFGIDVRTRKIVYRKGFQRTRFLNDILARDENTLYVTATDIDQFYEVDLLSDSIRSLANEKTPRAPNGLGADLISNYLYLVSFGTDQEPGEIGRYKINDGEYETVIPERGKFDGIFYTNGRYYMSDWGTEGTGRFLIYDIRNEQIREIKPERGFFQGPADFFFDNTKRQIWLPCMLENAVYIINTR